MQHTAIFVAGQGKNFGEDIGHSSEATRARVGEKTAIDLDDDHWSRSAMIGSTFVARRAGMYEASSAVTTSKTLTLMKVSGS